MRSVGHDRELEEGASAQAPYTIAGGARTCNFTMVSRSGPGVVEL